MPQPVIVAGARTPIGKLPGALRTIETTLPAWADAAAAGGRLTR